VIVADTSAIIAIASNEPLALQCALVLAQHDEILVSAGTITELLIVAIRKNLIDDVERLLSGIGYRVIDVTESSARRAGDAYRMWGKGFHSAGLNFGDCFAYALAKEQDCPLLFIGNDFSKTDIKSALDTEGDTP
jgi:ribonuclease VapC